MKFTREKLDKTITLLLPLAFIGPVFLNLLAYVMDGQRHETFRLAFVLGIQGLAALLFLAGVFLLWKEKPAFRRPIVFTALIPVLLGVVFLWALCIREDRAFLVQELVVNGCYLVSLCCAVLLVWAGKKELDFLKALRVYAVVISPVVLYYCVRMYLPGADYSMISLGNISYMSLAYFLMALCFFLFLQDALGGKDEKHGLRKAEFPLFVLFCIAITLSGTKGAILCLLWGLALTALFFWRIFPSNMKKRCLRYPLAALVCVVLFSTLLFPNIGIDNRVVSFLKEATGIKSVEVANEEVRQTTDILNKMHGGNFSASDKQAYTDRDIISAAGSDAVKQALEEGLITQEEYDALVDIGQKLNKTSTAGRKYYWNCAFNEIREAPLTGRGPLYFWCKYGSYPHNFFLEAATDFGLPFMCLLCVFGLYTLIRLFRRARNRLWLSVFLLYVVMYLPEKLVSGSLYDFSVFFQYGFCILFAFLPERYFMGPGEIPAEDPHHS